MALNHPTRWVYTGEIADQLALSRLPGRRSNQYELRAATEREPENPWNDKFHDMRGLFITNARTCPRRKRPAAGAPPRKATSLNLLTRVYNYSLGRARWDGSSSPLLRDAVGDRAAGNPSTRAAVASRSAKTSCSIRLRPSAAIRARRSTGCWPKRPSTPGRENQTLAFWVAVWIEDASGSWCRSCPATA